MGPIYEAVRPHRAAFEDEVDAMAVLQHLHMGLPKRNYQEIEAKYTSRGKPAAASELIDAMDGKKTVEDMVEALWKADYKILAQNLARTSGIVLSANMDSRQGTSDIPRPSGVRANPDDSAPEPNVPISITNNNYCYIYQQPSTNNEANISLDENVENSSSDEDYSYEVRTERENEVDDTENIETSPKEHFCPAAVAVDESASSTGVGFSTDLLTPVGSPDVAPDPFDSLLVCIIILFVTITAYNYRTVHSQRETENDYETTAVLQEAQSSDENVENSKSKKHSDVEGRTEKKMDGVDNSMDDDDNETTAKEYLLPTAADLVSLLPELWDPDP